MKSFRRQHLVRAATGTLAVAVLAVPGLAGAQQSDPRKMEETTVTSTTSPIVDRAPAARRTGIETRATVVNYGDLNLNHPAGVNTLYSRLETASREVCAPRSSYHHPAMSDDWRACYSRAMNSAVAEVGNLALEHHHLAQTGAVASAGEQVADR